MTKQLPVYVLDTSVLLATGKQALYAYPNAEVVIPLPVVVELDKKKADPLVGFFARAVLRELEAVRNDAENGISDGIELENGSKLRIEVNHVADTSDIPESVRRRGNNDFLIMAVAKNLDKDRVALGQHRTVTLVSNDLSMRILAEVSLGIPAQEHTRPSKQGEYTGIVEAHVLQETMDEFYKTGSIDYGEASFHNPPRGKNIGAILSAGPSAGGVAVGDGERLHRTNGSLNAFGVKPRSAKQAIALTHLLNDDLPVVSLGGAAGTGKSILAIAAGLEKIVEQGKYDKIVVFRPLSAVGNENLGYLPGDESEKMAPWAGAVYDALEAIGVKGIQADLEKILHVLPVTHIRGRTLNNSFVIIDEAQNLEKGTLLSVLSRAGEASKMVFSWDAAQRDNLNIGKYDGVVSIVDRLKYEPEFAHVTLDKSERSRVAELASRILEEG